MSAMHRILVVDDEPLNVKLFGAILSSDNYEIIRAFSGEQALKKVNEECPDLVLLDIMMPGIDGFEVTRRLKSSSETKDIPIILITAFDVADYKVIGHEAGADEFLNKPVKAPELRSRVKSLLSTKECQDKLRLNSQTEHDQCRTYTEKTLHAENKTLTVLLVFEEQKEAESIKMLLHGQPYEVIIEKTAREAIALSNQSQIDLILFDGMLEGEACFEICRRFKEKEQTANTQILVVADPELLENKHHQFEVLSDDFLIKPINVHELRARVKALLKKKSFLDRLYAGPEGSVSSAIIDSISGLANYSYFKYSLEHEIKRSLRDNLPLALVLMELNDVKHNPNSMGHLAGEELLRDIGTLIRDNMRDVDIGARYKEKQFALILANTNKAGTSVAVNRLRKIVQNHFSACTKNSSAEKPSLNFGIAYLCPPEADSIEALIIQAEKDLLRSKDESRSPTTEPQAITALS
jgi:two-component system cell cycle response regulator